jgi:hypothetical protein
MLKGKTGNLAINKNDLVQIGERGKLWPVTGKLFADVAEVGAIKTLFLNNDRHNKGFIGQSFFDQTTQSTYALLYGGIVGGTTDNWSLMKISKDCQVQANVDLEVNSNLGTFVPKFTKLSNGNLVVVRDSSVVIYSPDLIQLAAPTLPTTSYVREIKALSGGGFAIIRASSSSLYLRIHANDGSAIYVGATAISTGVNTTSTRRCSIAIDQLSDGNIVIFYQLANNTFQYTIVSPTGATVVAPTLLTGISSSSQQSGIKIAVINGFFCCAVEDPSGYSAVVLSNSGVVRNYRSPLSYGVSVSSSAQIAVLMTEGNGFWMIAVPANPSNLKDPLNKVMISYLGTSGNNAENKDYSLPLSVLDLELAGDSSDNINYASESGWNVNAFLKNGVILLSYKGNRVTFDINNSTIENINPVDVAVRPSTRSCFAAATLAPCGNGVAVMIGGRDTHMNDFVVQYFKYTPTAILGVSQSTIAAGNENTLLNVNASKGQLTVNPIPGDDIGFDFTTTSRRGQKGVFSFDSVIFNDGL